MTLIFHSQNQFLTTTRMKIVHNLGDMGELLDIELDEHVDIAHEYRTLRKIIWSFRVKDKQVIISVEKTNPVITYHFLYRDIIEKYIVDLLGNISENITDVWDWNVCDSHYRYNTMEKITANDIMRKTDNSSFWKYYAAGIGAGPPANESRFDLTPPPHSQEIKLVTVR
jgi:hypothetical protein